MKFKIVLLFFLSFIFSCTQEKNTTFPLLKYIPENSSIIIKINELALLKSELKNNDFLNRLEKTELYTSITDRLAILSNVNTNTRSVLAFVPTSNDTTNFLFATKDQPNIFPLDTVAGIIKDSAFYKNQIYYKYVKENNPYYTMVLDSTFILSSSISIIEGQIENQNQTIHNRVLYRYFETSGKNVSASLFINTNTSNMLESVGLLTDTGISVNKFTDWLAMDLNVTQDHIRLSGISTSLDSTKNYIDILRNTRPVANVTHTIAPIATNSVLSYSFDNYLQLDQNRQVYLKNSKFSDSIFRMVEEIGCITLGEKKVIVLNTYGSEDISIFLDSYKGSGLPYQGYDIFQLTQNNLINSLIDPMFDAFPANYYTVIENAFVFSEEKEMLQVVINNYKLGSTFLKSQTYDSSRDVMSDEASITFLSNSDELQQIFKKNLSKGLADDLSKIDMGDYFIGGQVTADNHFYHVNLVLQKFNKQMESNTTTPLFTVALDGKIATTPQFVINHRTHKKEIIVQDEDNHLYLISTQGKVLWKKKLDGRIQGKIEQVDLYKNGRLQLAFTTHNQFLILDRTGSVVSPFKKAYKGGNLNALAVFDYDNDKDYRFLVTQGDKVFMYNAKGDIVKGFTYTKSESRIITSPRHIRISKKDFLVFLLQNGTLKILNRSGATRIKVPNKITFSQNGAYSYLNKIILTDAEGTLFAIDTGGKITKTKLNLNEEHGIDATSKTLVTINDNVLTIKEKKVDLDLGVYTKPRIFYIHDTIYVSVTDIQNENIYVFNSDAKLLANFPVFGSSDIDLADIDNDRKVEIVTKDQDSSLILYKMN